MRPPVRELSVGVRQRKDSPNSPRSPAVEDVLCRLRRVITVKEF